MKTRWLILWVALLAPGSICPRAAGKPAPVPKLFAFCVGAAVPGQPPLPLDAQARLLHESGYSGIGCELWLDRQLEATLRVLDEAGVALDMVWAHVKVNPAGGPAFPPSLPAAIRQLKGRSTVVGVLLSGLKPGDPNGMEPAVKALRELGDAAAEAGVRISIYNHVDNWTESLPFIVEVVRKTDHPQVGFHFNLCHWLKVSGQEDYRPLLRANAAKLFCVTLNGANAGAIVDPKNWVKELILPLDEGTFDPRPLVETLREMDYRGPVGLMCYGVPGEPRQHLARSMATWRKLNETK